MLTMHVRAHSFDGPNLHNNREAFFFEVDGLPEGQQAQIVKRHHLWQTRRAVNSVWGEWSGQYDSAEEALSSLVN